MEDVLIGLTARQKYLPSKYLYNKRGDEIFQQIMAMPEYYLTRAEHEIFSTHKAEMLEKLREGNQSFHLIEFGAGDGMKTKVLLRHCMDQQANVRYVPIDISENILKELSLDLATNLPALDVQPIGGDYFDAIEQLPCLGNETRKVVLFLGANIGNFSEKESNVFLRQIASRLAPGDRLMIGFDLKKDPAVVLNAYFDKENITRAFNLNLLQRINEELGANFDLTLFQYFPLYDPMEGAVRSYLVSQQDQTVHLEALNVTVHFDAWEAIYTEKSQKFNVKDIEHLAQTTGFRVVHHFFDRRQYFTDSLWELNE